MALSCSTQILQRSWLVYFRQGTLCLASSATNAGFRSRALTSSSYVLRSHFRLSQNSLPVWKQRPRSPAFGFQSIRALSSSSLESAQGSGQVLVELSASSTEADQATQDFNDVQEDGRVTAAASMAGEVVEVRSGADADSSIIAPEDGSLLMDQNNLAVNAALQEGVNAELQEEVNAALQEEVEEALGTVDLLDDEGRPESVSVDSEEAEELEFQHPWSEWQEFLNMLEAGGHFVFETVTTDTRPFKAQEDDSGRIKRASMAFARSRDDILNSLSPKLLRVIAEFGCPSTDRKIVNAGKRLRVSLDIAEGSVCKPCDIRNACARAYNKPPNIDVVATQDVVRLLVGYAMVAKSTRTLPGEVESAAKDLLLEIVRASEIPRDPSLPLPVSRAVNPPQEEKKVRRNAYMDSVDMKPGDWKCPECNFVNFSRNSECRECQIPRPPVELPPGDWQCPDCGFINFSRNVVCRKCQTQNSNAEIKEGDWLCPR